MTGEEYEKLMSEAHSLRELINRDRANLARDRENIMKSNDRLRAENARLREALELIADGPAEGWIEIARAALGSNEPRPVPHGEEPGMSGMG